MMVSASAGLNLKMKATLWKSKGETSAWENACVVLSYAQCMSVGSPDTLVFPAQIQYVSCIPWSTAVWSTMQCLCCLSFFLPQQARQAPLFRLQWHFLTFEHMVTHLKWDGNISRGTRIEIIPKTNTEVCCLLLRDQCGRHAALATAELQVHADTKRV